MSKRSHAPRAWLPRRWAVYIFLALISATTGWVLLEHVLVKNRIVNLGHQQQEAEHEIDNLNRDIRGLNVRIEEALSRKNLQSTLAKRRTRLRPIQPGAPIIITAASQSTP
ncbi:MAG: hypothetical protein K8R87_10955 [Verrucomicrobia bacterium]|nr:hypothetical protein [Verrucomicrobiota bacterium]